MMDLLPEYQNILDEVLKIDTNCEINSNDEYLRLFNIRNMPSESYENFCRIIYVYASSFQRLLFLCEKYNQNEIFQYGIKENFNMNELVIFNDERIYFLLRKYNLLKPIDATHLVTSIIDLHCDRSFEMFSDLINFIGKETIETVFNDISQIKYIYNRLENIKRKNLELLINIHAVLSGFLCFIPISDQIIEYYEYNRITPVFMKRSKHYYDIRNFLLRNPWLVYRLYIDDKHFVLNEVDIEPSYYNELFEFLNVIPIEVQRIILNY